MLDTDTKRRIDTARDILVGKVPDPKSQVEQITIALIYKFMDDMDAESEEFGGKRKFFANEFARYGWAKLMRSGLGGHEILNLYAEAIAKMPENPGILLLFRDIFKNAYLPYRDPETLRAFLKVIDEFTYDHSERLGDAFEYLLSVLGSQGEAGQFRTPRHIIDFIVEVIEPKKNETVLDPACGTAGFLISSYKHILKANTDAKGNSILTPDEKGRLAQNFKGYDISPDMVRLSLVNLYLHGFADPHIAEYDTLTSQERWNEYADVILANPPFMSPKGGIRPHNRFSVQSKRSEVLFVDYMAEHLTPSGRAGIIVPEGIIFQSQTAYTQLRKMLVEEYLVAVVSLPAGVFNPYSGVKTSILILDKSLAKKTKTIAFFKVENDGFGLGAQRREIEKNDLPQAQAEIGEYLRRLRAGESVEDFQPLLGLIAEKEKISANGEYNLSGERYREGTSHNHIFPLVELGELCELYQPQTITQGDLVENGPYLVFGANGVIGRYDQYNHEESEVLVTCRGVTCGTVNKSEPKSWITGNAMVVKPKDSRLSKDFLYFLLKGSDLSRTISGSAQPQITRQGLAAFPIALPPLEVQKEIVAEIEGYQKVISGARAVLDHYRPHIPIHPDWPMVALGDAAKVTSGYSFSSKDFSEVNPIKTIKIANVGVREFVEADDSNLPAEFCDVYPDFVVHSGDMVIALTRSIISTGLKVAIVPPAYHRSLLNQRVASIQGKQDLSSTKFIYFLFCSDFIYRYVAEKARSLMQPNLSVLDLKQLEIPLPPLATQQTIVAEIEAEQALVAANRELITRFEKKIQATLARIWGEEEPTPVEA